MKAGSRQARRVGWLLSGSIAALALRSWGLPLPSWRCPLRQLTGTPCPTCYLTRSLLAALRGDLATALHWHPLGPGLLVLALGLSAALLLGVAPSARRLVTGGSAVAALTLAVWLTRLWQWSHGQPLPG